MARCTLQANEKDKKYFKSPPAPSSKTFLCQLHAGRGGMQVCDTLCHAMITRKLVVMETVITIVRRHISVAFLEQSRQQIVTNLETDHYTENREGNFDDINA